MSDFPDSAPRPHKRRRPSGVAVGTARNMKNINREGGWSVSLRNGADAVYRRSDAGFESRPLDEFPDRFTPAETKFGEPA